MDAPLREEAIPPMPVGDGAVDPAAPDEEEHELTASSS